MNLLKTLFGEEGDFFEVTHPQDEIPECIGTVVAPIEAGRLGRVRFQGVRWRACCDLEVSIPSGTKVFILGRRSNILVVKPIKAESASHPQARTSLEIAIDVPEGLSSEEIQELVQLSALAADAKHRAHGGQGLKLDAFEVLEDGRVLAAL